MFGFFGQVNVKARKISVFIHYIIVALYHLEQKIDRKILKSTKKKHQIWTWTVDIKKIENFEDFNDDIKLNCS